MSRQEIRDEIVRIVDGCYADKNKDRRISLNKLRKAGQYPNTADGLADAKRDACEVMDSLKSTERITWYGFRSIRADSPEWIFFMLPPFYAREGECE